MNIVNAEAASYKLTSADIDDDITLAVFATDQEGQSTPAEAMIIGPVTIELGASPAPGHEPKLDPGLSPLRGATNAGFKLAMPTDPNV